MLWRYYISNISTRAVVRMGVLCLFLWAGTAGQNRAHAAATFRVVTYNLENYLDAPAGTRPAKSPEAKAAIRAHLRALGADVVALQEVGSREALRELRAALQADGLDYPHWEFVSGFDTNVHVAVLSRFPFAARRPHTNENYLLFGRRFRVSRGFAEVEIQVHPKYSFTLIAAHLKSRREVAVADEAEMRGQEAILLRELVDARLKTNPDLNLIVLGDFNDTKDTKPIRTIIGRGRNALVDSRPAERNGDNMPSSNPRFEPRNITWTHYFGREDVYSRIDYILLSRGMAKEWLPKESYVLAIPNWGIASDHRPIVGTFEPIDK